MEKASSPAFLNTRDIEALESFRGRMITGIMYHTWVNRTKTHDVIRVLDTLEIQFDGNRSLFLQQPEDVPGGIRPVSYDVKAESRKVELQFGPMISIESHSEDRNALWEPLLGGRLDEWLTYTDESGRILADELILRCGKEYVQVRAADDGLEVFPWEPDEKP